MQVKLKIIISNQMLPKRRNIKIYFISLLIGLTLSFTNLYSKESASLTISGMTDSCKFGAMIYFSDKNNDNFYDFSLLYNCKNTITQYMVDDKYQKVFYNGMLAILQNGNIDSNNWSYLVINPETYDTLALIFIDTILKKVIIDNPITSTNELMMSNDIIFGNYCSQSGEINILNKKSIFIKDIIIFDILGNIVSKNEILNTNEIIKLKNVISRSSLNLILINTSAGIYFLKIIIY